MILARFLSQPGTQKLIKQSPTILRPPKPPLLEPLRGLSQAIAGTNPIQQLVLITLMMVTVLIILLNRILSHRLLTDFLRLLTDFLRLLTDFLRLRTDFLRLRTDFLRLLSSFSQPLYGQHLEVQ